MNLRPPIRTSAFKLVVLLAAALLLQLVPGSYVARASGATNVGVVGFSGFGGDPDYRDAVFGRGRLRFFLSFFVTNGPADNVVLTDQLPAGVTYVSDSLSGFPGGVYDRATNTVTWNLGTITRGPSDPLQLIVQTDPGVADGAMLTNPFSISTTTPQTTTADDSVSDQFQVGFLPLQISEQTSYSCDAHAQNTTTDRKSVDNGAPVACGAEGTAQSSSSTQGPAAPMEGQIAGPNDVFEIGGVGVSGYADGAFNCASPATCLQGSASADATTEVRVQVTNPNPYSVRLHTITDMLVWAEHGNECTSPSFPGDAQVAAFRDAVASGCIYSQLTRIHLDDCKTISCATIYSETTSWPDTSGPDPELDPAGVVQVNEQSAPPDSDPCSNGTFVGAGAHQQTIAFLGFDDVTANGSTKVTTLPDGSWSPW